MTDQRAAFYAAMAKAQGAIEGAAKTNENPHFKSKYADLAAVWDACRDHLSANGIAVLQFPDFQAGIVSVQTTLTHSQGFQMSFTTRVPVSKQDAQGVGSAITYARRYALMAAVGIAPEEDDGNEAVEKTGKGTGYRANGQMTAAKAKNGEQGSWQSFIERLDAFSDPDECEKWFHSVKVQGAISAWPKGDAGDWAELAGDRFDQKMQELYGTAK